MPLPVQSRAQAFEFTEEEIRVAYRFPYLTECGIRHLLSSVSVERSKIPVDPMNPLSHVLQLEYLRGQIEILEHLLDLHESIGDVLQ